MNHPPSVHARDDGDVRVLAMAAQHNANALSDQMVDELIACFEAASHEAVPAVVLTSECKQFCGGFDLNDLSTTTDAILATRMSRIAYLLEWLYAAPFATIASVGGAAIGSGGDLAIACDQRIGSEGAKFRFPGSSFGIVLGTRRLAFVTSSSAALRLTAEQTTLVGREAATAGLLSEFVDSEAREDRALALARVFAKWDTSTRLSMLDATRMRENGETLAAAARSAISPPGLKGRIQTYLGRSG